MDMRTNSYNSGRALASGIALFALAWSAAGQAQDTRSEEHTSELQSLMRISYAVFCLKKINHNNRNKTSDVLNRHRTNIGMNVQIHTSISPAYIIMICIILITLNHTGSCY